jgi:hypothetical protein
MDLSKRIKSDPPIQVKKIQAKLMASHSVNDGMPDPTTAISPTPFAKS